MPVITQCSGCGRRFRGPDEIAGKRVKCPNCSLVIQVPNIGSERYAHPFVSVEQRSQAPVTAPRKRQLAPDESPCDKQPLVQGSEHSHSASVLDTMEVTSGFPLNRRRQGLFGKSGPRRRRMLLEQLEFRQMLSLGDELFDELLPALQGHTTEYYEAFYVYRDRDSGANHFVPSWFTNQPGLGPTMSIDTASIRTPGNTCIEVSWNGLAGQDGTRWNGVGFVEPDGYEGIPLGYPYSLFDGSPAPQGTRLLFEARIDLKDENDKVEFGFAGSGGPTPEHREWFDLTQEWTTYGIDLSGRNLSAVHLGFVATVNDQHDTARDGVVFYLDNIRYEWPRPEAPRLIQSFLVEPDEGTYSWEDATDPRQAFEDALTPLQRFEVTHANTAYVYDQVVGLMALQLDGTAEGTTLSVTVGEGLREAWDRDWSEGAEPPLNDPPDKDNRTGNRLYDSFSSGDPWDNQLGYARPTGWWVGLEVDPEHPYWIHNYGLDGGNHAWAVLGCLQMWEQTGDEVYLSAATDLAEWVVDHLKDPGGGFWIGWDFLPDGGWTARIQAKSTEHNTDLYAAFSRLSEAYARQGNDDEADCWRAESLHAGDFVVDEMFDPVEGRFSIGTSCDQDMGSEQPNTGVYVLDAQTWTYLALADSADYANAIDWSRPIQWAENMLKVTHDGLVGFDFGYSAGTETGPDGIWWEGTAQMALVYLCQCQMDKYGELITSLGDAFDTAATSLLPASSVEDGITTGLTMPGGDPWLIFRRGHVAATAWALFAAAGYNPFWDSLTLHFEGSPNNDRFEFTNGGDSFTVSLNGPDCLFSADRIDRVVFCGGDGVDEVIFNGIDHNETARLWPDHAEFTGSATVTAIGMEVIVANMGGGDGDTVKMHGTDLLDGYDELGASPSAAIFLGKGRAVPGLNMTASGYEILEVHSGAEAGDVAFLYDSPGADQWYADPSGSLLTWESGAKVQTFGFRFTHAYAGRGYDTIELDDSSGDDELLFYKDQVKLYSTVLLADLMPAYVRRAKSFEEAVVYADAGRGPLGDVAYLHDGKDVDDVFTADPLSATMELNVRMKAGSRRVDRKVTAAGFDQVHGYSRLGGTDTASLTDSAGNDVLIAKDEWTKLYNDALDQAPDFFLRAKGFDFVHGQSIAGGRDTAYMYDSWGRDVFAATPEYAQIYGLDVDFDNKASGFKEVYTFAIYGGEDTATLVDSSLHKDMLEAALPKSNPLHWLRFFSDVSSPLDYFYYIRGFEQVDSAASNADDDDSGVDPVTADWLFRTGW